jgi:hypothetical protein
MQKGVNIRQLPNSFFNSKPQFLQLVHVHSEVHQLVHLGSEIRNPEHMK